MRLSKEYILLKSKKFTNFVEYKQASWWLIQSIDQQQDASLKNLLVSKILQ